MGEQEEKRNLKTLLGCSWGRYQVESILVSPVRMTQELRGSAADEFEKYKRKEIAYGCLAKEAKNEGYWTTKERVDGKRLRMGGGGVQRSSCLPNFNPFTVKSLTKFYHISCLWPRHWGSK